MVAISRDLFIPAGIAKRTNDILSPINSLGHAEEEALAVGFADKAFGNKRPVRCHDELLISF
jgi:hypothetical protein